MNALIRMIAGPAAAAALGLSGACFAHGGPDAPAPAQSPYAVPQAGAMDGHPAMDPLVRAIVIGIAASILREAAAQPDPVDALGNAVERRLAAALADPNTMRLIEGALRHAFQDAPAELREPLALFASSVLHDMRREMLRDRRPRPGY
jgi:hypothetical protein